MEVGRRDSSTVCCLPSELMNENVKLFKTPTEQNLGTMISTFYIPILHKSWPMGPDHP